MATLSRAVKSPVTIEDHEMELLREMCRDGIDTAERLIEDPEWYGADVQEEAARVAELSTLLRKLED